jgi:hypothetical protein
VYRQRLAEKNITLDAFDPVVQEILTFNKKHYSSSDFISKIKEIDLRERRERSFMDAIKDARFYSAELNLGVEKKWDLPIGLTELDIQRFCIIFLLRGKLKLEPLGIEKNARALFDKIAGLNPELAQIDYKFPEAEAHVLLGVASRYNINDINFAYSHLDGIRYLLPTYQDRLYNLSQRYKTLFPEKK